MTEVHEDWGELYPYSDYKRGEVISYRLDGQTERGEIIWVKAGSTLPSGRYMPQHYIVANDKGGWPDSVYFSDVIVVDIEQKEGQAG
jgi:hypothetical protein